MTTNPHDKLFKGVFSDPDNAAVYFATCLPPALVAALDLSRIEHVPGSWVDEALREHHSDLLFRIGLRAAAPADDCAAGEEDATPGILLYVLFEHQSTVLPRMPLKILRYLTRVLDEWSREHLDENLPPVVPLVLYHGAEAWTAPLELEGLYELSGLDEPARIALRPYLPQVRYLLEDVSATADEALGGRGIARLTLLVFKHGRSEQLATLVFGWQEDFRTEVARGEPGLHNIRLVVEYLLVVSEVVNVDDLTEALRSMPEAQDISKSTGRMLVEQGIEQGIEQGRKEVALKLLAKGMPPVEVAEVTELPLEQVLRLAH